MVAEKTSVKACVRTVEAYYTLMQLLYESENSTAEHVQYQKKLLTSFLMALEFVKPNLPDIRNGDDGEDVYEDDCDEYEDDYDDNADGDTNYKHGNF